MIKPKVKSLIVAVVALSLTMLNVVVFTQTSTSTCSGGETFVTESKSRGFPLSYWSQANISPSTTMCEFSSLGASKTFILQAVLVNLIVAGAILMGTHLVLDYRRGKK